MSANALTTLSVYKLSIELALWDLESRPTAEFDEVLLEIQDFLSSDDRDEWPD